MIPDNTPATPSHIGGFEVPVKTLSAEDKRVDWEMGGIALNDPSEGLRVQLWTFKLVVDEVTGASTISVEAPSVTKTVLFTGVDVSEIAGAFDQNMNPVVAYMESGSPKLWWWDPTESAMVHTLLPSGCYDLRVSLDDKRRFNVEKSDVILSYVRGGSAYYRYQRDRYLVEYLLSDNIDRIVCAAMNTEGCFQWRTLGTGDGVGDSFSEPFLGDIVFDLCRQAGIPPERIVVAELYNPVTDRVPGLLVDSDDGLDKPIKWLMDMFQFDKVEHGGKLRFIKRGRPVVARIPFNKLVDDYPKTLKRTQRDRSKLPRTVNINHIDPDGGFAKNKQSASRRTNMSAGTSTMNIDSRVVLTADQAASAALRKLKIAHNEYEDFEFTTRLEYTYLTPGDVVEVEDFDGTWYRVHLTERNEDDGNIKWEAETDGGYLVYDNIPVPGKPLDPPVSTTPGNVGDTVLEILNLPVQRDQDDELGLYVAARGTSSGWTGYTLSFSVDGGNTYADAYTSQAVANIGETVTAMTDTDDSVEVLVPYPLESVTAAQVTAGYNRAVIGDEEIRYRTATLIDMVDGQYHYLLENISRGTLRTNIENWGAGIRFVAIDGAVLFLQIQREHYGLDIYYKATSIGQSPDEVAPLSYTFDFALSQTEWAVGDVLVEPNPNEGGKGVKVSWTPAPRLGTFGAAPFESKYFLGYRLKFGDGFIVDVPPGTTSYIYENAYDAGSEVTVEVWSLNEITGECAWKGGLGTGGGGGEEPGGGEAPPPVTIGPGGGPASTSLGPNGGYPDNTPYPVPQPTILGSNVISNPNFSSPGLGDWKKQNGSALDSRWSNTGNKLRYEGAGSGDMAAYNYGAFYSVPIWPFARYTFTVSGKVQCITSGTKVALGVARGFSTAGNGIPTYSVDTITDFAEYVSETTISKSYTHVIDVPGRTLAGQYVIGTFMPVFIVRSTTGETQVVTLDDVSMVITEYMPEMAEIFLDNIDFPANDQTGWNRFPYVPGMSAEIAYIDGYARFAPTNPYAVHSYMFNLDKLNNHVSWAAGHRVRIKWKSWCNDPTAFNYITTNGSGACIALRPSGDTPPDSVPGWTAALVRGDYTEYEFWMEMPGDSATFDAYFGMLMKCIVGKEVRFGDIRVWITDNPEP